MTGIAEFSFDDIFKRSLYGIFLYLGRISANLKVLKSGGKSLIVFLGLVIALILCQNFIAIGLAKLLHISPASRALYRFDSDDRRAWNSRCIRSGS